MGQTCSVLPDTYVKNKLKELASEEYNYTEKEILDELMREFDMEYKIFQTSIKYMTFKNKEELQIMVDSYEKTLKDIQKLILDYEKECQ